MNAEPEMEFLRANRALDNLSRRKCLPDSSRIQEIDIVKWILCA